MDHVVRDANDIDGETCLVRDDRNHGMMWQVNKNELIHHIANALDENPDWLHSDTDKNDEKAKVWAWAGVSFPAWARPTIPKASTIRPPVMKPLIKS